MAIWASCAISKFVDWLGSDVVNKHVSTGYSYLCDRILSYNREAKLKRLRTDLPQIKAVMGVAEALKVKDPNTSEWVEQFRQAVEASQLVLNEVEYKNQDEAGGSTSSSKKRKRCTINDGTLKKLKDAVTLLDRATTDIDRLLQLAIALGVHGLFESRQDTNQILRREINLCLAEREVFGCSNLIVNLPRLKLSYLEIDHLCLSPSLSKLTSLRYLRFESSFNNTGDGFSVKVLSNLMMIRCWQTISTRSILTVDLSNSTADLSKDITELLASMKKNDINRQSQKSLELALNQSGLTCPRYYVGFLEVTSSDVAEIKNRERHEVGESSHSNEFMTMDVD